MLVIIYLFIYLTFWTNHMYLFEHELNRPRWAQIDNGNILSPSKYERKIRGSLQT